MSICYLVADMNFLPGTKKKLSPNAAIKAEVPQFRKPWVPPEAEGFWGPPGPPPGVNRSKGLDWKGNQFWGPSATNSKR
jgi:hypothetical protein